MGMIDLYTIEQAEQALSAAIETKEEFLAEIENLNSMIFILKYYLATGDALDPAPFGIEEDLDD